ncbi:MAG: hypothetical protein WCH39_02475 [Schlesneria sp.]
MKRVAKVKVFKNRGCNQFVNREGRRGVASIAEVLLLGIVASMVWLGIRIILAPMNEPESESNGSVRNPIVSLSVICDGRKILARRGYSEIVTFDLEHDRIQTIFGWNGRPLQAVSVSQDGETCLVSIEDRELLLFRRNELLKADFLTAKSSVQIAVSLNGQTAVRLVDGTSLRRWDLSSEKVVESDYSFAEKVDRISVDFEGNRTLVSTCEGALHLCDAKTGVVVKALEGRGCLRADPVFSDDGSCVVIACNRSITLYELPSGDPAWTVRFDDQADQDWLTSVTISPNGQWVAASGIASPIHVLNRACGRVLHRFSRCNTSAIAFSSASDAVYSGSLDGSICRFSLVDGRNNTLASAN